MNKTAQINWGDEPTKSPKVFQPGFYAGLENDTYRAADGVSKSELSWLLKNPAMFEWAKNAPVDDEKTDALVSGSAFHCAVLEPQEFASRYAAAPVFNMRTNDGKAQHAEWLQSLPAHVKPLDSELHRKLMFMRDSVYAHPTARSVLEACEDRELSGFYVDPVTGARCKFRPDAASRERHIIADLKQVADFDRMDLVFEQLLYHLQDAMYSTGWHAITGEWPTFVFICCSSTCSVGRYPVDVVELELNQSQFNRISREDGLIMYRQLLDEYVQRKRDNDWITIRKLSSRRWK
jgi:exodeoxyribonuclease VIII